MPTPFRRAADVVVDSKDQARLEAGDFVQALEDGACTGPTSTSWARSSSAATPAATTPQDVTLFKSLGLRLEDVAVAARVYAAARSAGAGREVEF